MLLKLFSTVPVRGEVDRAALAVHSTLLEHGFVSVGAGESEGQSAPVIAAAPDGSVSLQILPPGWNASGDSYVFNYVHPLRGAADVFTVKALAIGNSLAVHAASSAPTGELLSVTLTVAEATDGDPVAAAARAKEWQEKVAVGVVCRLLALHNSTARLTRALEGSSLASTEKVGSKRPAPEDERLRPSRDPEDDRPYRPWPRPVPGAPTRDPFGPVFWEGEEWRPPLLWTPDGGLLGPRHPAWGQVVPGRGRRPDGSGGILPRFDPIGPPGYGEPNPDHLRVPRFTDPDTGFPGFPFGHPRPGRTDPDGMFIL